VIRTRYHPNISQESYWYASLFGPFVSCSLLSHERSYVNLKNENPFMETCYLRDAISRKCVTEESDFIGRPAREFSIKIIMNDNVMTTSTDLNATFKPD
jgi:hypothetical protein